MKQEIQAYWKGSWVPSAAVSIPLDDLGFLMGITVVERLRTVGGELFRASRHLARLRRSLTIMGWDANSLCLEIAQALDGFIERNGPLIPAGDDWSVIAFVTPGNSAAAEEPTVCVYGHPLPFQNWAAYYKTGLATVIVDIRQVPDNCWPTELKCRSRMHYFLADRQAESRQPGARAILLDQDGFVGEGSTANIVAYFADRGLVTPLRSKVLPGVTQELLYELAESLDIPRSEANLLATELAGADELYFTSTSIYLLPVVQLNNRHVGTGQPGMIYQKLLSAWSEQIGLNISQQASQFSERK